MENRMKIVTDSAADLTKADIEDFDIRVAPLLIQFPEGEISSENISADDFYNRLQRLSPRIPTTSQPSSGTFKVLYEEIKSEGQAEILSIHISSGLSGTIESARAAAQQLEGEVQVSLFDTMTLSGTERFHVLAAALGIRAGWKKEAILGRLEQIRAQCEVIYTLETLEYLARGGRIGRIQALAGSLLRVKPVIKVEKEDGKYSTAGKERTIQKGLLSIINNLSRVYGTEKPLWVSIMHGQFEEQANMLAELTQKELNVQKI
jgi:DegV family protein with EDD domain